MPPRPKPAATETDDGKRYAIGLRVSKAARERLEQAAAETGRSLSQEVEMRLEDSFRREQSALDALGFKYGDRFAEVLIAAADAGLQAGRLYGSEVARDRGDGIENWTTYPTAFKAAIDAMQEVLMALRPVGGMKEKPVGSDIKSPRDIAQAIVERGELIMKKIDTLQRGLGEVNAIHAEINELQARLDALKKSSEA